MKKTIFITTSFLSILSFSQETTYNDVAVIVNDNSQTSINIGEYFRVARNIPSENIIHISCSTLEEIDTTEFALIKNEIETYLLTAALVDSINYIVTTKGIPLKISRGNCDVAINCTSFDSELTILLSNYQANDVNPYHLQTEHFSRNQFDMYLVSRLDAFSQEDVFNMIDRSGPATVINKNSSNCVLDLNSQTNQSAEIYFVLEHEELFDSLTLHNWSTLKDTNSSIIQNENNVIFYSEQHYNSLDENPDFNWVNGSFSEIIHLNSAKTFNQVENLNGDFLLAELISEGVTAAHGYCYPLFFGNTLRSDIFINRYLDPSKHFNLAESVFSSERRLASQSVTIGDPKTTLKIDNTLSLGKKDNDLFELFPNSTSDVLNIISGNRIEEIEMFDLKGKQVLFLSNISKNSSHINLSSLGQGSYILHLKIEGKSYFRKVSKI